MGAAYPNSPIVYRLQRPGTNSTPSSFVALEDDMSGARTGFGTATCIVRRHQHMLIITFLSTIVSTLARRRRQSHTPHATHHTYTAAPMGHDRWST